MYKRQALAALGRPAAAVAIASEWTDLSCGVYNSTVLPLLIAAAPAAGVEPAPFSAALAETMRDKKAVLVKLDDLRAAAAAALGAPVAMGALFTGAGAKAGSSSCDASVSGASRSHRSGRSAASVAAALPVWCCLPCCTQAHCSNTHTQPVLCCALHPLCCIPAERHPTWGRRLVHAAPAMCHAVSKL